MTPPEDNAPVREGDVIASKYRVERVLGAGGMGVVVLAMHIDLEQRVAIKFLLPEAAKDLDLVERFLREGRASVRLRGVHVVKVIDVGRLDTGAPFLVMEYLEGQTLRDALAGHPSGMPTELLCSFLLQACEGIAEAHALGIVHRDLKPENLFVTHGADGRPLLKVLDFGISKVADESFGGSLTKTNTLFGSPMYMSPEQMRSAKHVDPRADVWSLGVIGYELACGMPPFDSETFYDLCLQVATEEPPALAERRPDLPRQLVEGIERAMHKPISARTQNVAEFAACLEPFAGMRARGTTDRLRDVIRASGAAFASLAAADPSNPNNVQSAWGATERLPQPRRRWVAWAVAVALTAVVGAGTAIRLRDREPPPTADVTNLTGVNGAELAPVTEPPPAVQELPKPATSETPPARLDDSPPSTDAGAKELPERSRPKTPNAAHASSPLPAVASAPPSASAAPPPTPSPAPIPSAPSRNDGFRNDRE